MPRITVVGGVNYDIGATSDGKLLMGDSNPGRVRTSFGGVGRNIAHNLVCMGTEVSLITVFGDDAFGDAIRSHAQSIGMDLSGSAVLSGKRTSSYVYLAGPDGDMALAVNDMDIYSHVTPEFLAKRLPLIAQSDLCVVDTNIPEESITYLAEHCPVPLFSDPVSAAKAPRLRRALPYLFCCKPNRMEAELLSGMKIRSEEDVAEAAERILENGMQRVCISLSADGLYLADRSSGERLRLRHESAFTMCNTTGCGDSMTAALAAAESFGLSMKEAGLAALRAAALTAGSYETISPAMSREIIYPTGG